jgi:hypothetical protein
VLCSAVTEGGRVPAAVSRECRARYLEAQLRLFPKATVVALRTKAQQRLRRWPNLVSAYSVAPPGCNHRRARKTWNAIPESLRRS